MQLLLIPVLGLAPGLLWLWLIYRGNKYRPDPKGLVIRTFLFGMVATIPVTFVETGLLLPYVFRHIETFRNFSIDSLNYLSFGEMAYLAFIVAGFTEELFKFLVVKTTIYKSPYYDEPVDGLVYSSAAALGFASVENIEYLILFGWQTALVRAPITTLAHVVFSAMWGYPLALKKLKRKNSTVFLWLGLIGAMAGHGLYDFLAFQQNDSFTKIPILLGMIGLFGGLIALFVFLIRRSQRLSPFKEKNADLLISCPNCGNRMAYDSRFCPFCGIKLVENKDIYPVFCAKCGTELSTASNFCISCGSRIIRKTGPANEPRR
jgi:RsiW-degrading membrane proteinase PrsW (M82 family)